MLAYEATYSRAFGVERTIMASGDRRNGFTLLEVLIVVTIVMILAVTGAVSVKWSRQRAYIAIFQTDIRMVKEAAGRFEVDCGFFPPDVYRGVDPGLVTINGWQSGNHSATWDELDLSCWNGPYLAEWKKNPWGGLYDWDNYPAHYTAWGIPGGGVYVTLKPSTWGGAGGLPPQQFEDFLEEAGWDASTQDRVIAARVGHDPS